MIIKSQNKQRGAAAIFIVLFFALLIGVITLSFITIVSQDQQQAINNDLSQSAYDSAEAGVEDGKRILQAYRHCPDAICRTDFEDRSFVRAGTPVDNSCHSVANVSGRIGVTVTPGADPEVKISRGAGDELLDQAYSCVSIATQTPDFTYTQEANKVDTLIPLKVPTGKQATNLDINWFDKAKNTGDSVNPLTFKPYPTLEKNAAAWGQRTPSLLKVQLIKIAKTNIVLDDVDQNSRAIFLYPSLIGTNSIDISATALDLGRNQPKPTQPAQVQCSQTSVYACSINIAGINTDTADYYLRVIPLYNQATYQVQMRDSGGTVVDFDNVQPSIDSTGRANNLFRRLQTRVTYSSEMTAPLGGFDSTESICKNFSVAVSPGDFNNDGCSL